MISVLIPVFNQNIIALVQELIQQLQDNNIPGEILVYDDGSGTYYKEANRKLNSFEFVQYKELSTNHGRIEIRKLLASAAQYDWFLFLDGDSKIISSQFLSDYIEAIKPGADVITGGRRYEETPPEACQKRLHWKYGMQREAIKGSSGALHTNNFLIRKEIFNSLLFPDQLKGYGYEDIWIDIELRKGRKKISFIKNMVLHDGVEDADVFLEKIKQALNNLLQLAKGDKEAWSKNVRIYRVFCRIRKFKLEKAFSSIYRLFQYRIEDNLRSCNPSLLFFDVYRLHELIRLSENLKK